MFLFNFLKSQNENIDSNIELSVFKRDYNQYHHPPPYNFESKKKLLNEIKEILDNFEIKVFFTIPRTYSQVLPKHQIHQQ